MSPLWIGNRSQRGSHEIVDVLGRPEPVSCVSPAHILLYWLAARRGSANDDQGPRPQGNQPRCLLEEAMIDTRGSSGVFIPVEQEPCPTRKWVPYLFWTSHALWLKSGIKALPLHFRAIIVIDDVRDYAGLLWTDQNVKSVLTKLSSSDRVEGRQQANGPLLTSSISYPRKVILVSLTWPLVG